MVGCASLLGAKMHRIRCASTGPTSCMTMNVGAEDGLIPAKVSDRVRAIVMAGLDLSPDRSVQSRDTSTSTTTPKSAAGASLGEP